FHAAPGGVRTTRPYSQSARWSTLDTDRDGGCIRNSEHAYSADGGLAVLYGNLPPEGAIVKTAGVPEELFHFSGPAIVFESQEAAVEGIVVHHANRDFLIVTRNHLATRGPR